ncbi:ubiquitin-conjugating enzyme/RWD-like protein [Phycomyces nitens]|nr:ubiquitin-conjugating enzyme/RWD-like protein [Phycomyces nitens]
MPLNKMLLRIKREYKDVMDDKAADIDIEPGDTLGHFIATISGPRDTPYEGGRFKVDMRLADDFPFKPTKLKFITPIYHPNISSQTGAICMDILKDGWSPIMTIKASLLSLIILLSSPVPDDPQDAQVASHYLRDYDDYVKTAAEWTAVRAKPEEPKEPKEFKELKEV